MKKFMILSCALAAFAVCAALTAAAEPLARAESAPSYVFSMSCKVTSLNRELGTAEGRAKLVKWCRANHVSKLWLESYRHAERVPSERLIAARDGFRAAGFEVCGMITPTRLNDPPAPGAEPPMVVCWGDTNAVERLRAEVARVAKVFDTVIVDDFLFSNCDARCPRCAAQMKRQGIADVPLFRREQLLGVSEAILAAAKAANPRAKFIVKFPCWYQSYARLGYDPLTQTRLFGACWVGTEARDANPDALQGCRLIDAINRLVEGRCGGGWFDALDSAPEKFIEQARYTILGGAKETLVHCYDYLLGEDPGLTAFGEKTKRAKLCARAFERESDSLFKLAVFLKDFERTGCGWERSEDGRFLNVSWHAFAKDGERYRAYQNNSDREFVRGDVRVPPHGFALVRVQ